MREQRDSPTRLLRTIRAVRHFAARPIPAHVLRDILNCARWTGSSKNTQPWEVVVVRDGETLRQLSTLGRFAGHVAEARVAVALVMNNPANAFDAGRLAQNLMLAAWAHGLGSCIGSVFPEENERRAKALLGVPEDRWLRTLISLGYPADEATLRRDRTRRALPSVGRKPVDQFVNWDRYGRRAP